MPFVKGQSGNPGGRPKTAALVVAALREPARLEDKIRRLEALCAHRNPNVAQRAIETWLAYALGRPPQTVALTGGENEDGSSKPVQVVVDDPKRIRDTVALLARLDLESGSGGVGASVDAADE